MTYSSLSNRKRTHTCRLTPNAIIIYFLHVISMLCYVMLYVLKCLVVVVVVVVVGGGGFKISPRAPTEPGPALHSPD